MPTTWDLSANAIDELAPLAAVPWALEHPNCAYVFIASNPMSAPTNPASAAEICASVGLTLTSDDDALSCAPPGC